MGKVVYLGPYGTTFTHLAFNLVSSMEDFAHLRSLPYQPASSNEDTINTVVKESVWGVLATETLARGRVDESWTYLCLQDPTKVSGIDIIAGIELKISFVLFAREGVDISHIRGVLGHTKALEACEGNLAGLGVKKLKVGTNGEGARMISEDGEFAQWACLAPIEVLETYTNLHPIQERFEDLPATTCFMLFCPKSRMSKIRAKAYRYRAVVQFETHNEPGALIKAISVFAQNQINMRHIDSAHTKGGSYRFIAELDLSHDQLHLFDQGQIYRELRQSTVMANVLGPYPMIH